MSQENQKNVVSFPGKRERKRILRRQQDRRVRVVATLQRLTGGALLLALILFFAVNPQFLKPQTISRLLSYITFSVSPGKGVDANTVSFESGGASSALCFGGALATADKDILAIRRPGGITDLTLSLGFTSPVLIASEQALFAYDAGGTRILAATVYGKDGEMHTDGAILSLSCNSSGALAAVTDESGYKGAVTVFDKHRKRVYKWSTSEYYVMCAAVAPNGRQMAAGVFTQSGVDLDARVLIFDLDRETPTADISLGNTLPLKICWQDNDSLFAISDQSTQELTRQGKVRQQIAYSSGDLVSCSVSAEGCLLAVAAYEGEKTQDLWLLSGGEQSRLGLIRGAEWVSLSGDYLSVLTGNKITVFDRRWQQVLQRTAPTGVRQICQRRDGAVYAVYQDRAVLLLPGEEEA